MHCSNCGTQLPSNANFCFVCGQAVNKNVVSSIHPVYETCEIVQRTSSMGGLFSKSKFKFVAKAIGPKGVYDAATSKVELPYLGYDGRFYQVLESFIGELTADGWEYVGIYDEDNKEYAKRFRRRVQ